MDFKKSAALFRCRAIEVLEMRQIIENLCLRIMCRKWMDWNGWVANGWIKMDGSQMDELK